MPRPRIVQVSRDWIDLATERRRPPLDSAKPTFATLGFDWSAFERAYDPATWGRDPGRPAGGRAPPVRSSARRRTWWCACRRTPRSSASGLDAGLTGGSLLLDGVRQRHRAPPAAVRRLTTTSRPGTRTTTATGSGTREYDNLSLRNATHVWVDHCTLRRRRSHPAARAAFALGRPRVQRHDGLLDITRQSDCVTVSWNHFRDHDKSGAGGWQRPCQRRRRPLRVTLPPQPLGRREGACAARALWPGAPVQQPVHGEGRHAARLQHRRRPAARASSAQNNVWVRRRPRAGSAPAALVRRHAAVADSGSLLNGQPVDLLAALRRTQPDRTLERDPRWSPTLFGPLVPAADTASRVRRGAGAGAPQPARIESPPRCEHNAQ
jgi:pectate lyase